MSRPLTLDRLRYLCSLPRTPYNLSNIAREMGGLARWWLNEDALNLAADDDCGYPSWSKSLRELAQLPDAPGSCWVVFVLQFPELGAIFRSAFLLPLRWERGKPHGASLPPGLREAAQQVVVDLLSAQARPGGAASRRSEERIDWQSWGLQLSPVDEIDRQDLSCLALACESGFTSLAAGLIAAAEGGQPDPKVWATGCREEVGPDGLGPLETKLALARDWNVREFFLPESAIPRAQRWRDSQGAALELSVLHPGDPQQVADRLRDYLYSLDTVTDFVGLEIPAEVQKWYVRQARRNRTRAEGHYRRVLLPKIIERCRNTIQRYTPSPPDCLVTIASDHPELAGIAGNALQARRSLVLFTKDKKEEMEAAVQWLWGVVPTAEEPIPWEFDGSKDLRPQFAKAVEEFMKGIHAGGTKPLDPVASDRIVFDLTPGNKLMSLTLAHHVAREGQWLHSLRHTIEGRVVVPGTERPVLWRAGTFWDDSDAQVPNDGEVS